MTEELRFSGTNNMTVTCLTSIQRWKIHKIAMIFSYDKHFYRNIENIEFIIHFLK